jgi:hypothetical protein
VATFPRLDIIDPDAGEVVLWSFNDPEGTTNPGGVRTRLGPVRFGVNTDVELFEPSGSPGGSVVRHRDALWEDQVVFYPGAPDPDALSAGLGELSRLLATGGVMLYRPREASPSRYIDYLPSPRFAHLRGQHVWDLSGDPEGLPVSFFQQPGFRLAALEPSEQKLLNGIGIHDSNLDGQPDNWTAGAVRTAGAMVATEESNEATASGAGVVEHQDVTTGFAVGESWTAQAEMRRVSADVDVRIVARDATSELGSADSADWSGAAYKELAATLVVPSGTTILRIELRARAAGVIRWRRAMLRKGDARADFRVAEDSVPNEPSSSKGRLLYVFNPGAAPAPGVVTVKADTGARLRAILLAKRWNGGLVGGNRLADLEETKFLQAEATARGWTIALSADTTPVADAAGSGGNVAETAFTSNPTVMAKRIRATRTTKLDSLRGEWDVYLRGTPKAPAVNGDDFILQLRWGASLANPPPESNDEVTITVPDYGLSAYVDIPLGRIVIPDDITLAGLALEVWARRIGAGSFRSDLLSFGPVDAEPFVSRLYIPGGAPESWLGKDLVTPTDPAGLSAGAVSGTTLVLDADNEAGGTPPTAGLAWPVGRHQVWFEYDIKGGSVGSQATGRVRNITDANDAGTGITPTVINGTQSRRDSVTFDSAAGKSYQPQIVADVDSGGKITVKKLTHEFIAYLAANEQARTDPTRLVVEKVDSTGALLQDMAAEGGVPIWCPPGLSAFALLPEDVPPAGSVASESVLGRAPTVAVKLTPRTPG